MRTIFLTLILSLIPFNFLFAQTYKVGDQVVIINGVKLRSNGKNADYVSRGLVFKVKDVDKQNNLWIGNGDPGWIQPVNVIPLNRAAIDYFNKLIEAEPDNLGHLLTRAGLWKELGEDENAMNDYAELIQRKPSTGSYNNRGLAWYDQRKYDEAIADFDSALSLDPDYATGLYNRARCWRAKKDYDKAISDYTKAINLTTDHSLYYQGRGTLYETMGDFDNAIKDLSTCVRIDSKNAEAYYRRGSTYHAQGDFRKAISDYTKAVNLNPRYEMAYKNRGKAMTVLGIHDQALKNYDEVLKIDPKDADIHLRLAITHLVLRDPAVFEDIDNYLKKQKLNASPTQHAILLGTLATKLIPSAKPSQDYLAISKGKLRQSWPTPIVDYIRGDLSETDLLEQANDLEKQAHARCYIALLALANQDKPTALNYFHWIRDNAPKTLYEYSLALAELQSLDK